MQERGLGQQFKDLIRYTGILVKETVLHPRTVTTVTLNEVTGKIQVFPGVPSEMVQDPKSPTGDYKVAKGK